MDNFIKSGRIGTDEAGKGDYFGPLVVAAVWADEELEALLRGQGVKDSKLLTDAVCKKLAREIEQLCPHEVVTIFPAKYNALIERMQNLNRLLGWAHARAIESLLEKITVERSTFNVQRTDPKGESPTLNAQRSTLNVITDQFGDPEYVNNALMQRGKTVHLVQQTKAESETVVAAASILARAGFLSGLDYLSKECGLPLPKGATHVLPTGREIYKTGGLKLLSTVAKIHFKTTKQVMGKA
jgi:ribonuclease HIII